MLKSWRVVTHRWRILFSLYKKGMELLKYCSDRLDTVEKKMLQMDEDGTLREILKKNYSREQIMQKK